MADVVSICGEHYLPLPCKKCKRREYNQRNYQKHKTERLEKQKVYQRDKRIQLNNLEQTLRLQYSKSLEINPSSRTIKWVDHIRWKEITTNGVGRPSNNPLRHFERLVIQHDYKAYVTMQDGRKRMIRRDDLIELVRNPEEMLAFREWNEKDELTRNWQMYVQQLIRF